MRPSTISQKTKTNSRLWLRVTIFVFTGKSTYIYSSVKKYKLHWAYPVWCLNISNIFKAKTNSYGNPTPAALQLISWYRDRSQVAFNQSAGDCWTSWWPVHRDQPCLAMRVTKLIFSHSEFKSRVHHAMRWPDRVMLVMMMMFSVCNRTVERKWFGDFYICCTCDVIVSALIILLPFFDFDHLMGKKELPRAISCCHFIRYQVNDTRPAL